MTLKVVIGIPNNTDTLEIRFPTQPEWLYRFINALRDGGFIVRAVETTETEIMPQGAEAPASEVKDPQAKEQ